MCIAEFPEPFKEADRRDNIPSLSLDRLNDDRCNFIGSNFKFKNLLLDILQDVMVTGSRLKSERTVRVRVGYMDNRQERSEMLSLDHFCRSQADRTIGSPVKPSIK